MRGGVNGEKGDCFGVTDEILRYAQDDSMGNVAVVIFFRKVPLGQMYGNITLSIPILLIFSIKNGSIQVTYFVFAKGEIANYNLSIEHTTTNRSDLIDYI